MRSGNCLEDKLDELSGSEAISSGKTVSILLDDFRLLFD